MNRAALQSLFNGAPPYSAEEEQQNIGRINTNVNFLEGLKILHDARRQFATAFQGGDELFNVQLDYGPKWKKRVWSEIITREINKRIKSSAKYLDCRKSVFALDVLHGIGPAVWDDRHAWCPKPRGIEDVLIPSNTLTSLENLPFFAVYRQYTGFELWKKTHGPKVDKGWNMNLVDRAISWVDEQAKTLMGATWPEVWSPEKLQERIKQDGALYASDSLPTVDTFDLYFWDDTGKKAGWRRKVILDAWGSPGYGGAGGISYGATPNNKKPAPPSESYLGTKNEFLYDSGDRVYAENISEIIHFQFADASAVAPFRYHSVRSLGFLLYAVCHLQNRLRCKFTDAVFESLLQYFRVANPADAERLSKVDLLNHGVIPEGLNFITPNERWKYDAALAEMGMNLNRQTMSENSASYSQDFELDPEKSEETATRTMAKVNSSSALVGSMLNDAYNQQEFQYREICRRFCNKNSRDKDVRKFRVMCLDAGVPEEALNIDRWNVSAVRVIGQGNKMLQQAMAQKLMAVRPLLDPQAQKTVDKLYVLANSDDPALADILVPDMKRVSDTVHDTQLAVGSLMQGIPVTPMPGENHVEIIETALHSMASIIQPLEAGGGMADAGKIAGLQLVAQYVEAQIKLLSEDKAMKERVKTYSDDLSKLQNLIKGYSQRLAAKNQQQNGNGGLDPKDRAKIIATRLTAQNKVKLAAESHAARTAQREIQFQNQFRQDQQKHELEMAKAAQEANLELQKSRMKAFNE